MYWIFVVLLMYFLEKFTAKLAFSFQSVITKKWPLYYLQWKKTQITYRFNFNIILRNNALWGVMVLLVYGDMANKYKFHWNFDVLTFRKWICNHDGSYVIRGIPIFVHSVSPWSILLCCHCLRSSLQRNCVLFCANFTWVTLSLYCAQTSFVV